MSDNPRVQKTIVYSFSTIFILWIILFELILPSNNFLPKPSIVWDSFGDLIKDYRLVINYLSTIAVIYSSIVVSYFLINLLKVFLLNKEQPFTNLLSSLKQVSNFIPSILFAFLLIYWLPETIISEFIFAILISLISFAIKVQHETLLIKKEYIDAAKGLGADENIILNEVKWKAIQPGLIKHILDFHNYFWTLILFFEYARNGLGLGKIFRQALEFKDLSALIALFIITGITICLGHLAINHFKTKHYFWN